MAAVLARAATEMCCERRLEVQIPALMLEQAVDMLAKGNVMHVANRTGDVDLNKLGSHVHE